MKKLKTILDENRHFNAHPRGFRRRQAATQRRLPLEFDKCRAAA
jgi:hypothetical protein